jgi:uncharacterized protein YggE
MKNMSYILPNVLQSGTAGPKLLQTGKMPPNVQSDAMYSGMSCIKPYYVLHPNIVNPALIHSGVLKPNSFVNYSNCKMKVAGKGVIRAEPDKASVVMGVVTENMQLENAQNENNQKVSAVVGSLIKNDVAREDIKTQSFQIQPQYDYINGEQVFRSYRVVHEISVEIADVSIVGSIIDEAVRVGANTVSDIGFYVSNPQKYYKMALDQALGDSISKAVSLGKKMNVYVDHIPLRITEKTASVTVPMPYVSLQATGASAPIQPGMNEITAILEAEFVYSCSESY